MKNEVIYIEKRERDEKPVEFTKYLSGESGWIDNGPCPHNFQESGKIVYLGKCSQDGDMFAAYGVSGEIFIHKGHLNSGKF
jgi:hypothetical protein